MANRNWLSNKMYQMEAYPCLVSCTFTVDNTNGAGVTNLKGGGVKAVYMNSSAPSAANPNPAAGLIQIELQDNYNGLLGISTVVEGPVTGANLTSVSAGVAYVITALGTTTQAQWETRGVPVGMTAAVNMAFICKSAGALGGTGTVKAVAASGLDIVEWIGDNSNLARVNSSVNGGGVVLLAARNAGVLTAPAAGSVVKVNLYLSNSSITVQGQ